MGIGGDMTTFNDSHAMAYTAASPDSVARFETLI